MSEPQATDDQGDPLPAGERRLCWDCRAEVNAEHFCPACGKVQPQPPAADHFSFFGLERRLELDAAALERRFDQLRWKLQPENFQQSTSYEQELAREKAAALAAAFQTLSNPVERADYVLALEGVRPLGSKPTAPADLLPEILALSDHLEALRSAKLSGDEPREVEELRYRLERAQAPLQERIEETLGQLTACFREWDQAGAGTGEDAGRQAVASKMVELLNRSSYLRALAQSVAYELKE